MSECEAVSLRHYPETCADPWRLLRCKYLRSFRQAPLSSLEKSALAEVCGLPDVHSASNEMPDRARLHLEFFRSRQWGTQIHKAVSSLNPKP